MGAGELSDQKLVDIRNTMRLISYKLNDRITFGAINANNEIIDLGARLGCQNIAEALAQHNLAHFMDIAETSSPDSALREISHYRAVVADPPRIFCVGLNYEDHRIETKRSATTNPTIFLRLPHSQVGHLQPIICPSESDCLDYEGEIAIVIGQPGRRIKPEQAWTHLAGISAYNDASVRDWQAHSTQWTQGKNFPATGAFGPEMMTTDEIAEDDILTVRTLLNGKVMQSADTSMMLFPIPDLISYISTFTELIPGDVIVTGTPGGVGFKMSPPVFMKDGDEIAIEVSKIGTLVNTIRKEPGTIQNH